MVELRVKSLIDQCMSLIKLKLITLFMSRNASPLSSGNRPLSALNNQRTSYSWLKSPITLGLGVVLCMSLFSQLSMAQGLPMVNVTGGKTVSYTHLTLPTIYSV